jgi:hypothetical protein
MEWLLLLLAPVALLMAAVHLLVNVVVFRELRKLPAQLRAMSRGQRALYFGSLAVGFGVAGLLIWAADDPGRRPLAGRVLLVLMSLGVAVCLVGLAVGTWREFRAHRRRRT